MLLRCVKREEVPEAIPFKLFFKFIFCNKHHLTILWIIYFAYLSYINISIKIKLPNDTDQRCYVKSGAPIESSNNYCAKWISDSSTYRTT